jgi:hypothetical protein
MEVSRVPILKVHSGGNLIYKIIGQIQRHWKVQHWKWKKSALFWIDLWSDNFLIHEYPHLVTFAKKRHKCS